MPPRRNPYVFDPYNCYRSTKPTADRATPFHGAALCHVVPWVPLDWLHCAPLQTRPVLGNFENMSTYFVAGLPNKFRTGALLEIWNVLYQPDLDFPTVGIYSRGMHRRNNGQIKTTCHISIDGGGLPVAEILSKRVLWDVGGAWVATTAAQKTQLVLYVTSAAFEEMKEVLYNGGCPQELMRLTLPTKGRRNGDGAAVEAEAEDRGGKSSVLC